MELDARKMQNPIATARKKILDAAVKRELGLLQKKIIMATEIGTKHCMYTVHPTLQHPDPVFLIEKMIKALKAKNFQVTMKSDGKLNVSWD